MTSKVSYIAFMSLPLCAIRILAINVAGYTTYLWSNFHIGDSGSKFTARMRGEAR